MEAACYVAFGLSLFGAAYLLYRAGGRFATSTLRTDMAEVARQVTSLEADFQRHLKRDAADASNARRVASKSEAPRSEALEMLRQGDEAGARASILRKFAARDQVGGNGGE